MLIRLEESSEGKSGKLVVKAERVFVSLCSFAYLEDLEVGYFLK